MSERPKALAVATAYEVSEYIRKTCHHYGHFMTHQHLCPMQIFSLQLLYAGQTSMPFELLGKYITICVSWQCFSETQNYKMKYYKMGYVQEEVIQF